MKTYEILIMNLLYHTNNKWLYIKAEVSKIKGLNKQFSEMSTYYTEKEWYENMVC